MPPFTRGWEIFAVGSGCFFISFAIRQIIQLFARYFRFILQLNQNALIFFGRRLGEHRAQRTNCELVDLFEAGLDPGAADFGGCIC